MSKLGLSTGAIGFGGVAAYYLNEAPSLSLYLRVCVTSFLLFNVVTLLYQKFIYPFYTSPTIALMPTLKRGSWKEAFNLCTPPLWLHAIETIPNEGLVRRVDFLNQEAIIITLPEIVGEFLLKKNDDFERTPRMRRVLIDATGYGLLTSEGHDHKLQRKTMAPAFNFRLIKDLYPIFWTKVSRMVDLLEQDVKSQHVTSSVAVVDIPEWVTRVSLDIIGQAGFGSDFDAIAQPSAALNKGYMAGFNVDGKSSALFALSMMTHPALTNMLPLKRVKEMLQGRRLIRTWIGEALERRAAATSPGNKDSAKSHQDIISAVMRTNALNTDGLVEQSLTLLAAGHETSATTLTWGIHELAQSSHIHYQTRLRAEVRAHLPSPSSFSPITAELLDSLPFLDAVCKEILRFHPAAQIIGRRALRDTTLNGMFIPKHTNVRVSTWAVNRATTIWGPDAGVFRPERWMEGEHAGTGGSGEALMAGLTFGHGIRGCIGKGFAQGSLKTLLAALIGTFEFKQVGGKDVEPVSVWGVTGKILGLEVETKVVEGW